MSSRYIFGLYLPPPEARTLTRVITPRMIEGFLDDAGIYGEAQRRAVDWWVAACRVGSLPLSVSSEPEISPPAPEAGLLSSEEAGRRLGLTGARVRQLARASDLPGRQDESGKWMFEAADVEAFGAERKGRP